MRKVLATIAVIFAVIFSTTTISTISISAESRLQQQMPPQREDMSPGEFFVTFHNGLAEGGMAAMKSIGMVVRRSFPEIGAIAIKTDNLHLLWALQNDPRVDYIEPVPMRYPLDLSSEQLVPSTDNGLYGLLATHSIEAQSRGVTGMGINVGVADTGIDYTHPDIAPNYKGGIDTVGVGDNDPWWNNDPNEVHGTHVAGTIAAANNSLGVLGVAYNVNLYHARVLGPRGGSGSDIMEGVRWLVETAHCKVVNMSLGGRFSSKTEKKFYKLMRKEGALIVCAAGNDGANTLSYPAAYSSNISVGALDRDNKLADFSNTGQNLSLVAPGVNVLSSVPLGTGSEASVSTTSTSPAFGMEFAGQTSGISKTLIFCGIGQAGDFPASVKGNIALIARGTLNFSEKVTNAMKAGAVAVVVYNNVPGDFVGTLGSATTPDGHQWVPVVSVSDTTGVRLKNQVNAIGTVVNQKSSWDTFTGTSMAAPHVTGVIALIWSIDPTLSNSTVEDYLFSTCTDLGEPGYDTTYGHGLVNASAAVAKAGK